MLVIALRERGILVVDRIVNGKKIQLLLCAAVGTGTYSCLSSFRQKFIKRKTLPQTLSQLRSNS